MLGHVAFPGEARRPKESLLGSREISLPGLRVAESEKQTVAGFPLSGTPHLQDLEGEAEEANGLLIREEGRRSLTRQPGIVDGLVHVPSGGRLAEVVGQLRQVRLR